MTLDKAVTGGRTRQAECGCEDGIPEGGGGYSHSMFRGRGWRVGQGQRLPGETKQEARLIPRALYTLSAADRGG